MLAWFVDLYAYFYYFPFFKHTSLAYETSFLHIFLKLRPLSGYKNLIYDKTLLKRWNEKYLLSEHGTCEQEKKINFSLFQRMRNLGGRKCCMVVYCCKTNEKTCIKFVLRPTYWSLKLRCADVRMFKLSTVYA
ncbi:Protein of unknown function [Gryllus bimaculatus]|nr:Protein of unknown function [Gryllus bimaculatus]